MLSQLLASVDQCQLCSEHLPLGPRPVLRAASGARVVIIGQAQGSKVHASGVPWDDPSGKRLRQWLNVSDQSFYDTDNFAIVPMGFCYPGKGKSGDLPPRPECARQWHEQLLACLPEIKLTLLIGSYAQARYLPKNSLTLTERVRNYKHYLPDYFPLVHPSPRNQIWLKRNPWFEQQVVVELQQQVARALVGREWSTRAG